MMNPIATNARKRFAVRGLLPLLIMSVAMFGVSRAIQPPWPDNLQPNFRAFGPREFLRTDGEGDGITLTESFSIKNPAAAYVLKVEDGDSLGQFRMVSDATVWLNGVQILSEEDFEHAGEDESDDIQDGGAAGMGDATTHDSSDEPEFAILLRRVMPLAQNTITVRLEGRPRVGLRVTLVGVDNDLPVVTAIAAPAANTAGWNRSDVSVSFTAVDATSAIVRVSPPALVTDEGANQLITGTATDEGGNTGTATATLNIDKTSPQLTATIEPPVNTEGFVPPGVVVTFSATDALSGIASVSGPVTLESEGNGQLVTGTATDVAGNVRSLDVTLNVRRPITIPTAPVVDAFPPSVRDGAVDLAGRVEGATTLEVSAPTGVFTVPVSGSRFTVHVPLELNAVNHISLTGIATAGRGLTTTIQLTNDTEPPVVAILFPASGAEIFQDSTDVAGRVSDMLSGFNGLSVQVNGVEAVVDVGIGTNGTFLARGVPLVQGQPTILTATARDFLGNERTTQLSVSRGEIPAGSPRMELVAGERQMNRVMALLPDPVVVRLTQGDGTPFANKIVDFRVVRSDGELYNDTTATGALRLQVRSDANGIARAFWRVGSDAGCGNNRLEVVSTDVAGSFVVCASSTPAPPKQINIGSGNNQKTEVGAPALEPLRAWVSDGCNGGGGVAVKFRVLVGGGKVNGEDSVVVATSRTGHAAVSFTLGPDPGNNEVEATFPDQPDQVARFTAVGLRRDTTQPTRLAGLVLDNASRPIGGVQCTVIMADNTQVNGQSDAQGQFHFTDLQSGPAKLHVDGLPATTLNGQPVPIGSFPALTYELFLVPNAENSLPTPVLLPPLDPRNARDYSTTHDVELTVEGMEGLRMLVRAGSMRLPNGQPAPDGTIISLNQVHHDDVPMPMPDGAAPPFAWTLQPGGSHFDPPVSIIYPNMSGLMPGAIAYFLSFNHGTGRFEIVAPGSVTEDGLSVLTDPETGISVAGWGCNCPPYSVTSACRNFECNLDGQAISEECSADPWRDKGRTKQDPDNYDPCLSDSHRNALEANRATEDPSTGQPVQRIDDGDGDYKYDDYIADIPQMPSGITPESFLASMLRDLNGTINNGWFDFYNQFSPHGPGDPRVGEVVGIDIVGPDNGSVVISQIAADHFVFTTVKTPGNGTHPENGSRAFGFERLANGSTRFYTRGASRLAPGGLDFARAAIGDRFQRKSWENMMRGIARRLGAPEPSNQDPVHYVPATPNCIAPSPALQTELVSATSTSRVPFRVLFASDSDQPSLAGGELFGRTDADGSIRANLPIGSKYTAWVYDPASLRYGVRSGTTRVKGNGSIADVFVASSDYTRDVDGDGLTALAEFVVGCDSLHSDTDGDGVLDGDEVAVGTNPNRADLDSSWTVSVGSQTAAVKPDGSVTVANITAADLFGAGGPGSPPDLVSDDVLRLIGYSTRGGVTSYVFSEGFQLSRGQIAFAGPLVKSSSAPPLPAALEISIPSRVLTALSQSTALGVRATMPDGSSRDLTRHQDWTTYRTSNPSVVRVSDGGLVTAAGPGGAILTASNGGATASVRIDVVLGDPLTTVDGIVRAVNGSAVIGALVQLPGLSNSGVTGADGHFSITGVATRLVNPISVAVSKTVGDTTYVGEGSASPVPGGITDVGIITVTPAVAVFENQLGTRLGQTDDTFTSIPFTAGFSFPFYGQPRTTAFVGSNGYVTFTGGDGTFTESLSGVVNGLPRLSAFFDDLYPPTAPAGGGVFVNQLPGRFVVTWNRVPHFGTRTNLSILNTIQMILFEDGRIQFGYRGISSVATGQGVGITPGGNPPFRTFDFSAGAIAGGAGEALAQMFNGASPFDLDNGFLLFRPNGVGGYDAQFIRPIAIPGVASIFGQVKGENGIPMAGCRVDALLSTGGVIATGLTTGDDGSFRIDRVPLGVTVSVVASEPGSTDESSKMMGSARVLQPGRTYAMAVTSNPPATKDVGTSDPPKRERTDTARSTAVRPAPTELTFEDASPVPFNRELAISFGLPRAGRVALGVFDVAGRHIATIVNRTLEPGWQRVKWNGTRDNGAPAGAGVYFVRLQHGGATRTKRVILIP